MELNLANILWTMRYKWRMDMDGEDHIKIYPDGRVQVLKFDKSSIAPLGHEVVAEFSSIEKLEKAIADERGHQEIERSNE